MKKTFIISVLENVVLLLWCLVAGMILGRVLKVFTG